MADLNIKGPDAFKLIRELAVNSVEKFPVDSAKQYVAVNPDGYVIGDNILFRLEEDEYQAVGMPPTINWLQYHAAAGGYDVASGATTTRRTARETRSRTATRSRVPAR